MLKARKVSGNDTLILQEANRGSFAVPREWTDQADPPPYGHIGPSILSLPCLLQLVDIVHRAVEETQKAGG